MIKNRQARENNMEAILLYLFEKPSSYASQISRDMCPNLSGQITKKIRNALRNFRDRGLVDNSKGGYKLTEKGRIIVEEIFEKQEYSQTQKLYTSA